MDKAKLIEALTAARLNGSALEAPELDCDLDGALGLQLEVLRALERKGKALAGWKIGFTSGGGYDLLGPGFRPFGFILTDRVLKSEAVQSSNAILDAHIEPEICLRIGNDLRGSNLSPAECRAAVPEIYAAYEVNETRVDHAAQPKLFVADGMANWGLVIGDGAAPKDDLAETKIELSVDGTLKAASPENLVMDDPFLSLSRLCAQLDRHGLG